MVREKHATAQLYNGDKETQRSSLTTGEIPVAVYGLGKMGLPLAAVLADVTENVIGVDIDPAVVEQVASGGCPVDGEPGLSDAVQAAVADGHFEVTTDPVAAATDARVHVVIVPTVLDNKKPDLSALEAAVESIGAGLSAGDMVILESTVPPGTCREVVEPMLVEKSGLDTESFGLAFCPERTASGRALRDIRGSYPKVVGGKDEESTRVASMLYGEVTSNDVLTVSDCTTAECVKLFEGLYRDVNIALANELAQCATELSVDVREAIDVASMPSYCDIHSPGPGVGGHCIPYYPYFFMDRTETATPLIEQARDVNEEMPAYTVELLKRTLAEREIDLTEASVGLLGITYRAGVDETRAAPSYPIAKILTDAGTTVYAADPVCTDPSDIDAKPVTIDVLPALDLDALVLVTAHPEFETIGWDEMDNVVVIDGRDALEGESIPQPVYTLGDGQWSPPKHSPDPRRK